MPTELKDAIENLNAEQQERLKRKIVSNYFHGIAQAIEDGKIIAVKELTWEQGASEVNANITLAEGIEFINMEMKVD